MPSRPQASSPIIEAIHLAPRGRPFAVWEIATKCDLPRSTVRHVLARLRDMRYILRSPRAYAGRHYRHSKLWPETADHALKDYEWWTIVFTGSVRKGRVKVI
jgi:DNA-binding IclR family transcriptional regulator